jgi:hypothetical protein
MFFVLALKVIFFPSRLYRSFVIDAVVFPVL